MQINVEDTFIVTLDDKWQLREGDAGHLATYETDKYVAQFNLAPWDRDQAIPAGDDAVVKKMIQEAAPEGDITVVDVRTIYLSMEMYGVIVNTEINQNGEQLIILKNYLCTPTKAYVASVNLVGSDLEALRLAAVEEIDNLVYKIEPVAY